MFVVLSCRGPKTDSSRAAICKTAVEKGSGNQDLKRWYFDKDRKTCVAFAYGGYGGNRYVDQIGNQYIH